MARDLSNIFLSYVLLMHRVMSSRCTGSFEARVGAHSEARRGTRLEARLGPRLGAHLQAHLGARLGARLEACSH